MKLIRKNEYLAATNNTISNQDIVALDTGESVILTEPVKQYINIKYNALGYPDVEKINLGVQYDHRVSWLHFNLDDLIWHLNEMHGYDQNTKYQHYTFKIAFSRMNGLEVLDTSVWEFDGLDFELPRGITKNTGLYRIVLMIEEYTHDNEDGNVPDNQGLERFVTAEIKGRVKPTFYDPIMQLVNAPIDTNQNLALRKPSIMCNLTDAGALSADTDELGQKFDNNIRYLKFNPRNITAHLNDFSVFAIFKQNEKFYYSLFERTEADNPADDYSVSYPIIAWVPTGIYQSSGRGEMAVIAFTGDLNDINNIEEGNGDYYFYVSETLKMKVKDNHLVLDDTEKEPTLSITTNLTTNAGELIITPDDEIFQSKIDEVKKND